VTQILAWGSSYYLLAVLAEPIERDTDWPTPWVIGGLSAGLVVAGLVSPRVGDAIRRYGGRPILAFSAICLALGLAGVAAAPTLAAYVAAWLVIGVGMGAGLYDAAFATLGRIYGQDARSAITALTLFGGFASTASWPLSAMLVAAAGWRATCLAYAAIHILILLPLYLFALPKEPVRQIVLTPRVAGELHAQDPPRRLPSAEFNLVVAAVVITSMISATLSVHLLTVLQAHGLALSSAVALASLVGPAQVGARVIEGILNRGRHPVWTKFAATFFMSVGIGLLWLNLPIIAVALLFYGAGIGIDSIARGTLPLAVFGEDEYPSIIGRIAMPSLFLQAAAPFIGAILIERIGATGALAILFASSITALTIVVALIHALRLPAAARVRGGGRVP
jgi:hypothetical protein